jgi:peptidoglycan/LPS O-acetylase OafA/YrhL
MGTIERIREWDIPALDGYRALASLLVLTTHVGFATGAILWEGIGPVVGRMDFGVALFFLLSGFLLSQPWLRAAEGTRGWPNPRIYLVRRGVRIFPAYWIAMAVALIVLPQNTAATPADWVRYGLLAQIYSEPTVYGGLTHMWSLAVEVSFYVVLPALMWLALRWRRAPAAQPRTMTPVIVALLVVGFGFRLLALGPLRGTMAGVWLPGYLDWFAAGMLASYARVVAGRDAVPRWARALRDMAADGTTSVLIGVLLLIISFTPVAGPVTLDQPTVWEGLVKHGLYGASAFFLLLPAFLGRPTGVVSRAMSVPVLRRLGQISYGIFLWHLLLLELLQPALGLSLFGGGFWLLWPATVAASVVVATLSWLLVESPLLTRAHASTRVRAVPALPDVPPRASGDTARPVSPGQASM